MLGYVKIERCSHGGWYKDLIGHLYPVYRDDGVEFQTYQLDGPINFILKKDCKVINMSTQVVPANKTTNTQPNKENDYVHHG